MDTLAQEKLRLINDREKGTHCQACGQSVKEYNRPIHSAMAAGLIALYKLVNGDVSKFVHIREIILASMNVPDPSQITAHFGGGDFAKLQYWGLIEAMPDDPSANYPGRTNGFWRITPLGVAFVKQIITVDKYSVIYNDQFLNHDGPQVTILDCLGKKFNYDALMAGTL